MCHPGFNDEYLSSVSSYNRQRKNELAVLTDPQLRKKLLQYPVNFTGMPAGK